MISLSRFKQILALFFNCFPFLGQTCPLSGSAAQNVPMPNFYYFFEDHLTWTIQISMNRGTCERVAPEGRPHWQFLVSSATSLDHQLDPSTRFSPVSLPFILNFPEQRPWCRVTKSSGMCLHFLLLSHSSGGPCILLKTCKNMNSGSLEWVLSQAEGNFVATFIRGVFLQTPMLDWPPQPPECEYVVSS